METHQGEATVAGRSMPVIVTDAAPRPFVLRINGKDYAVLREGREDDDLISLRVLAADESNHARDCLC